MTDDDEAPPSAAESMRLIAEQKAATERSLTPDPRLLYWPWGFAWLIGFGLLYVRFGPDGRVLWNVPDWLPLAVLYALMVVAFIVSGAAGVRAGRHISGTSSSQGLKYGLAWFLGFASVAIVAGELSRFLPDEEIGLMWAALSVGLVAVLYMAGSAIWGGHELFVLGLWIGLTNIVGVWAGPGWHSLVISLAGGGGLIVAGLIARLRMGRW